MASNERKDEAYLKLQKKIDRQKKIWIAKNAEKQKMKVDQSDSGVDDNQMYARKNYTFIKDWQDSLKQRNDAKKMEGSVKESLNIELAKRAHDKEVKEKRKEKMKSKKETEFLPAIKTFVQKRSLLNKKDANFGFENGDNKREKTPLPQLKDENESEDEEFSSGDDNIESLDGIFLCSSKKKDEETVAKTVANIEKSGEMLKNPCFSFKPSKVIFKDFEINRIYKQKVTLVNIKPSPLSCKLIGISDNEVNKVIDLELRGPGKSIMPGMNCVLVVKFSTQDEDIDLDSNILMKTELGLFSIPIEIRKKYCCLSVHPLEIDFGTHVIGSTSVKSFQIINEGTKFASYDVFKVGDSTEKSQSSSVACIIPETVNDVDKSVTISKSASITTVEFAYSNNEFLIESGSQSLATTFSTDESLLTAKTLSNEFSYDDLIGIELNSKRDGVISGKDKVDIKISYKPQIPGKVETTFTVFTSDFKAKTFYVNVKADAYLPNVKVKENSYNFNICAYNHFYQNNIILVNDGNSKHDVTIELPKELKNHVEIVPKNGIIKPQSEFITFIKLFPKNTLLTDAKMFFDESTGILEFPVSFHVSEQPMTVTTNVNAIVSSIQIEFYPEVINFGDVYINESIQADVVMRNLGILSQQFGFFDVSSCINIEPNDGFGTLLPEEKLNLKIIFKPDIAMVYNSTLTCKTLFNRTFTIKWTGISIQPPVKFSYSRVNFPATRLNNISSATIFIKNTKKDEKQWISFEFNIPNYCPVQIFPNVGQISGGKSEKLHLVFTPKLLEQQVHYEAMNFFMDSIESEYESVPGLVTDEGSILNTFNTEISGPSADEISPQAEVPKSPLKVIAVPTSLEYIKAVEKLRCEFVDRVDLYTIPCYFMEGKIKDIKVKENQFSKMRPINLSLSCPCLKSKLKLLSKETIDFGRVSIGKKCFIPIIVCNVTLKKIQVEARIINTQESFTLERSSLLLEAKCSGKFIISLLPTEKNKFFEKLEISCSDDVVSVILVGESVKPELILSFEENAEPVLDLNHAIVGDHSSVNFLVTNPTEVDLELNFQFIESEDENQTTYCKNFSGINPFSINPMQMTIESKKSQTVNVTFSPDHKRLFSALIKLIAFDSYDVRKFSLKGIGSKSPIFVSGDNKWKFTPHLLLQSNINAIRLLAKESEEGTELLGSLIDEDTAIALHFNSQKLSNKYEITFIHSNLNPPKKPAEFVIENLAAIEKLGFSFDLAKGLIEVGKTITIRVKYSSDKHGSLTANALLKVKIDSTILNLTIYLHVK